MLTSAMVAVSNTSPLSNLAIIGRLDLVREQFGSLLISPAVRQELSRNPHQRALALLESAVAEGWIRLQHLSTPIANELCLQLDIGEAETLTLAMASKADVVLLDESAARAHAARLGLKYTGALGILRKARQAARISSLKGEIERLRVEARFFINPVLERALLLSVGES